MQNPRINKVYLLTQPRPGVVESHLQGSLTQFSGPRWILYGGQVGFATGVKRDGTPDFFQAVSTYGLKVHGRGDHVHFVLEVPDAVSVRLTPLNVEAQRQVVQVSGTDAPMEFILYTAQLVDVTLWGEVPQPQACHHRLRQRQADARREEGRQAYLDRVRAEVESLQGANLVPHVKQLGRLSRLESLANGEQIRPIVLDALLRWARGRGLAPHDVQEAASPHLERMGEELKRYCDIRLKQRRPSTGKDGKTSPAYNLERLKSRLQPLVDDPIHPLTVELMERILTSLQSVHRPPRRLGRKLGDSMKEVMDIIDRCRHREPIRIPSLVAKPGPRRTPRQPAKPV